MIHHERLTPSAPSRPWFLSPSTIRDPSIQEQIINPFTLKLLQRLLCKVLHGLEIRQLQRQDLKRVGVQGRPSKCRSISVLSTRHIAGAKDEIVRLRGLGKEMLDYMEALCRC